MKISKAEKKILSNIRMYSGVCHAGTIVQDTGYKFATVKKYIKKLTQENKIENIQCESTNKACYYITDLGKETQGE